MVTKFVRLSDKKNTATEFLNFKGVTDTVFLNFFELISTPRKPIIHNIPNHLKDTIVFVDNYGSMKKCEEKEEEVNTILNILS
jgi:hypothetical protein